MSQRGIKGTGSGYIEPSVIYNVIELMFLHPRKDSKKIVRECIARHYKDVKEETRDAYQSDYERTIDLVRQHCIRNSFYTSNELIRMQTQIGKILKKRQ